MKIHKNFPLSEVLWYKIGGKAKILIDAQSKQDILDALNYILKNDIKKICIIGAGSNILFPDTYFDGAVIRIINCGQNIKLINGHIVEAYAGEMLDNIIGFCFQNNLAGIEWAGGLPGTIGAAVRGNAGAFGGEIKYVFESAEVVDISKSKPEVLQIEKNAMNFSYRNSIIKQNRNLIVLSVRLTLIKVKNSEIEKARNVYFSNINYRKEKHPLEYASCGSVFKNIAQEQGVQRILFVWPDIKNQIEQKWHGKIAMGYVINRLGLSGRRFGPAQISEKHNNFIVNLGGAKYSDVMEIINTVKKKFSDTFGFSPET